MTTSTKTKSAKAVATTDTTDEATYTVAKVSDGPKMGKFVQFVAMGGADKPKVQWQVYMTDEKVMAHKINEGSRLTIKKSSWKLADAWDSEKNCKVLDENGMTVPSKVVHSWVNSEGKEIVYEYGTGTLDIGLKIVKNETNPNIGEKQARPAFDPMA
jgi:hypothetical protein